MGDTIEMMEEGVLPGIDGDARDEEETVEAATGFLVRLEDMEDEAAAAVGALVPMPQIPTVPVAAPGAAAPVPFEDEQAQWDRILTFAEFAEKSGLYGDENAVTLAMKALIGTRLGLDIATSFHALQQIRGKINIPAEVQRALARRAGYRIREVELSDTRCTLQLIVEATGEVVGESTFTWDDAKRAKLLGNEVWHQYPRRMLKARCSTDLISDFATEVLYWDRGK